LRAAQYVVDLDKGFEEDAKGNGDQRRVVSAGAQYRRDQERPDQRGHYTGEHDDEQMRQRRVRRAPNISYDTPIIDSEGMRTADDTDMYNGAPDRYDWELVGKREIYIPYNNYQIGVGKLKYSDILKPGHVNPEYPRYELHRVWVVEGKLKAGARHVYSRRTFYLDEDSWQIAVADQYDGRGELWRVSMALLTNFYVLPTTWSALDMYHDLQSRRLFVMNLVDEAPASADFSLPVPNDDYFSPAALRRRGTR